MSVHEMINIFAATGHLNHAKSSNLNLQLMMELPDTNPWLNVSGWQMVRSGSRTCYKLLWGP